MNPDSKVTNGNIYVYTYCKNVTWDLKIYNEFYHQQNIATRLCNGIDVKPFCRKKLFFLQQFRNYPDITPLIAKFMGPTLGWSGADRTQVGPMFAQWTLLSGTGMTDKLSCLTCSKRLNQTLDKNAIVWRHSRRYWHLPEYYQVVSCISDGIHKWMG